VLKNVHVVVVGIVFTYLLAGFLLVHDYGITYDEPENFAVGHTYLNFFFTGALAFNASDPVIGHHPDFYTEAVQKHPYKYGSFANILSAVTCYLFYQKVHLLDPISAHHVIIPMLTAVFLCFLFYFVRMHWGDYVALICVLALATCPRFFGETFNNIKDIPEIIFDSVFILCFAQWCLGKRWGWWWGAFLCLGVAMTIKLSAVLAIFIIVAWLLVLGLHKIFLREPMRRTPLVPVVLGLAVSVFVFFILYPPLYPWQHGSLLFVINMVRHYSGLCFRSGISWGAYAITQIGYTMPIGLLVFFVIGLVCIPFRPLSKNRLNVLLVVWTLVPLLWHCIPTINHYDGIWHLLIFIVPFMIITSIGAQRCLNVLQMFTGFNRTALMIFISALIVVPNLGALIATHPFQTTYFNFIAGGLKGAQTKNIPFCCDYWLNSYRKAGEWLQQNAKGNTQYWAFP